MSKYIIQGWGGGKPQIQDVFASESINYEIVFGTGILLNHIFPWQDSHVSTACEWAHPVSTSYTHVGDLQREDDKIVAWLYGQHP